ncbi:hypothetical protein O1611_g993 [Lasiodiplodia mahajangana]|uniref:Uncharacterized protein n=1 Tax=Lasiodiplodia mahajangana TaxID=1108764 RepID=A0ACC2JZ13_9PEZI|nr:hypothetical protein O1611_g993 [Lasiodiplodia mahajangana]
MRLYLSDGMSNIRAASSPRSVAEVLLAIFEASKKDVREVHITGGCDCAWVAAVAQWLLKMSVEIIDLSGAICWSSPDEEGPSSEEHVKLIIVQKSDTPDKLGVIKRCHILDGGRCLIPGRWDEETRWQMVSLGRVTWVTCLGDTFGSPAKKLLGNYGEIAGWCLGSAARVFEAYMCNEYAPHGSLRNSPPPNSASTARGFVVAVRKLFPEIRANTSLIDSIENAAKQPLNNAQREYTTNMKSLRTLCGCARCSEKDQHDDGQICMAQLIPFICTLVRVLYSVRMPPELSIAPSIAGMEELYWEHQKFNLHEIKDMWPDIWPGQDLLSLSSMLFGCTETYKVASSMRSTRSSAVSANGLCSYLNTMCNPTGPPDEATLVHIVPGRIYLNDFAYERILDEEVVINQRSGFYCQSARAIDYYEDLTASGTEELESMLNVAEMVDNSKVIYANYQISQKSGKGIIKMGVRELHDELCYAYTAKDCRGKGCQTPNGVRSICAAGAGYLTKDVISSLAPAPIIRVLPSRPLETLIAVTQRVLMDDPELAGSLQSTEQPTPRLAPPRIFLRKQLQGNQCVRCCLKNAMEGPRTNEKLGGHSTRLVCILTAISK